MWTSRLGRCGNSHPQGPLRRFRRASSVLLDGGTQCAVAGTAVSRTGWAAGGGEGQRERTSTCETALSTLYRPRRCCRRFKHDVSTDASSCMPAATGKMVLPLHSPALLQSPNRRPFDRCRRRPRRWIGDRSFVLCTSSDLLQTQDRCRCPAGMVLACWHEERQRNGPRIRRNPHLPWYFKGERPTAVRVPSMSLMHRYAQSACAAQSVRRQRRCASCMDCWRALERGAWGDELVLDLAAQCAMDFSHT